MDLARTAPAEVDFTAQTDLAASYGLLQMTYVNALTRLHWQGVQGGAMNPSYLFDTPQNLQIGGGSLTLGTEDLKARFIRVRSADAVSPAFHDRSDLEYDFVLAWSAYNGDKSRDHRYGNRVLGFVDLYQPVSNPGIFQ